MHLRGILRVPCKTRRASRCPSCAETYRADTYQLIRAGLIGGKGAPDTVTTHPTLFVTLTAPSFGIVHARREHGGKVQPCHARRNAETSPHGRVMSCTQRHGKDDLQTRPVPSCPNSSPPTTSRIRGHHSPTPACTTSATSTPPHS
ncbi:replication initiator [Nonomuraea indica]|uniref:Replication initiator n=1 Tax=Nonomuraea indica TaxID=1581193 RepID=A0ABW8A272_9ACTN